MGQLGMVPTSQNGILDEEAYNRARQQQSQMGLWAGLLAGGAPSLSPTNFGAALGKGLLGMQQTGNQFDESQLTQAKLALARAGIPKTEAEIRKLDREGKLDELIGEYMQKIVQGGGIGGGASVQMPGGGMAPLAGGAPPSGTDPASLVKHYESDGDYNKGWTGVDLSGAPRGPDGFPQWAGRPGPAGNSRAAGAYQFQPGTWAKYAVPLGIKDFSPESQDKVFAAAFAAEGWKPWAPYNRRLAAAIGQSVPPAQAGGVGILPLSNETVPAAPVPPIAQPTRAPLPPGIQTNSRGEPYNLAPAPGQQIPASAVGPDRLRQMGAAQAVPPRAGEPTPGDVAAINAAAMQRLQGGAPASAAPAPPPGLMAGGAMQQPPPAAPALPTPAIPPIAQAPQQPPAAAPPIAMSQAPRMPGAPSPAMPQGYGGINPSQIPLAQALSLGMSQRGRTVPGFISQTAELPLAGARAGAEAAARLPIQQQFEDYQSRIRQAEAGPIAQAQQAARGEIDANLARLKADLDAGRQITTVTINGREVPMTVAQAAQYLSQQNMAAPGQVPGGAGGAPALLGKPADAGSVPEGYRRLPTPDGGYRDEPIPGSAPARALAAQEASQRKSADIVTQDISRAIALTPGFAATGMFAPLAKAVPGTPPHDLMNLITGIRANVGFDRLQEMRLTSPTGAALGNPTEGEGRLLQSTIGSLEQSQSRSQLEANLKRLHMYYMDAVNGSPEKLSKALVEGKITREQHDAALAQRELKTPETAAGAIDKAAYDRLPSGSVFTAPDGSRRVKP